MDMIKSILNEVAFYAIAAIINPVTIIVSLILLVGYVETM